MITNEQMSPAADAVGARYGMAIQAWAGIYAQAANANDLGSARSFSRVRMQALEIGHRMLRDEGERMDAQILEFAEQAQGAVAASLGAASAGTQPEAASEAVSALAEHFRFELAVQIDRDVAFLTRALRSHALQVTIAARAQRVPLATAVLQARIGGARTLEFTMNDRGGARWPSRRYVRTLARQTMLAAYNEAALIALADAGQELAEVSHVNADAEVNGLILAMGSNGEHPTYDEIRDQVFHPNADAIVVAHGAA